MSFTPIALLFAIPLLLVMAGIVVAIVLVVMRLSRNPAGRAQGPVAPNAVPAGVTPEWRWNVHVRRAGHLDPFSGYGTLTLGNGLLTFVPDGAPQPAWAYPAPSFGIRVKSVLANSDLIVDSSPTGPLGVTVSHENINRVSRNNFKTLRERDTSGEFIGAMRAAGATILT